MKTITNYLKQQIKILDDLFNREKKLAYQSASIAVNECIDVINHNTYLSEDIKCVDDALDVVYKLDFDKYDYEISLVRREK